MKISRTEILQKALKAYSAYYDVTESKTGEPFVAEAEFRSHNDTYFLVKRAKLGEAESNEFVFFASVESLGLEELNRLAETAWTEGISRVRPHESHKNTDISLVLLADIVSKEAKKRARTLKYYKSYKLGLHGFSHFQLITFETSTGKIFQNRMGHNLKSIFSKIIKTT